MAGITGIEFGAAACALARTSVRRRGELRLTAAEILDPDRFSAVEMFSAALRDARQTHKLPRRARVVLWGAAETAGPDDTTVKPLLAPLVDAGFVIERVVSACDALAALARLRTPRADGATIWLGINRGGVAIVSVRPGRLLYSHAFPWDSSIGASGSQARLLQRYSLVSFLIPEIKRAIAESRKQGIAVDALVTCGNLPDLRSMTMPLIEELDLEVETLDSLEGLDVPAPVSDRLVELAPAIRLACAGVLARKTRRRDAPVESPANRLTLLIPVAVVLGVAAAGWFGFNWFRSGSPAASRAQVQPRPAPPPPSTPSSRAAAPPPSPAAAPPPARVTTPPRPAQHPQTQAPAPTAVVQRPVSPPPKPAVPPAPARPAPPSTAAAAARPEPPAPLRDPAPRVTGILISADRRYATIGGRVIGVGDSVGRRTVVGIQQGAVLFREPSGIQISVGLGGRVLAVDRRTKRLP